MKGYLWFIRRYGLRRLIRYERVRRSGVLVNWGTVFTSEEIDRLRRVGLAPARSTEERP